jgi:hypothetical protein
VPSFSVTTDGNPQTKGTRWLAAHDGKGATPFVVAQTVPFSDGDGAHRGLYQTKILNEIPALYYDRHASQARVGLWAHFIWPTVVAESAGGHHLLINSYDRARFTFGFYQLAAHTPADNLILLFRELLTLSQAPDYFPDLVLHNGKVHRREGDTLKSLEIVTNVLRPNGKYEDQIVGFMSYLNPDTVTAGDAEAINGAKLMHWLLNDPDAVAASVRVALTILRRKVKSQATTYKLTGKDPRLAIWVSDIRHQGRGTPDQIKAALASSNTVDGKMAALREIGATSHADRIATVKKHVATLHQEGVFAGVSLGDTSLPL